MTGQPGPMSGRRSRIDRAAGPGIVLPSRAAGPQAGRSSMAEGEDVHRWIRARPPVPQPDPEAVEFIRFCYQRRRVGWPELYDEMCAVAARGLYRGYGSDDLAGFGIGFSLFEMPSLAAMSARVVAEEQARRRPVSVTIRADVPVAAAAEVPTAEVPTEGVADAPEPRSSSRFRSLRSRSMVPGPSAAGRDRRDTRTRSCADAPGPALRWCPAQPDRSGRLRTRLAACPRSGSRSPRRR